MEKMSSRVGRTGRMPARGRIEDRILISKRGYEKDGLSKDRSKDNRKNKSPCCEQRGNQDNERKRVFEGEAPCGSLPLEGATRAPTIADGAKRKKCLPAGKLQGIHRLRKHDQKE